MKCIWHIISYSAMQFAFWASLHNRIREGEKIKKKVFHQGQYECSGFSETTWVLDTDCRAPPPSGEEV